MDERQSIKDSLRCLRKYGSTSSNNCNKFPDEFVKHIVTENDTLQGIALKYGVTVRYKYHKIFHIFIKFH